MLGQRAGRLVEHHPRCAFEQADFVGRQLIGEQQVHAATVPGQLILPPGFLQQRVQLFAQRFGIAGGAQAQHQQIDMQAVAPPETLAAHQGAQQAGFLAMTDAQQQQRPIARDAHAPQSRLAQAIAQQGRRAAAQGRMRMQQQGGEQLQLRQPGRFQAQLARLPAGLAGRIGEGPFQCGQGGIALGVFEQGLPRAAGQGQEGQLPVFAGFEHQAHLQRHHRVECPAAVAAQPVEHALRLTLIAVTAEEALPVAVKPHHRHARVVDHQAMQEQWRFFLGMARTPGKQQGLQLREILAADEQLAERRVAFVVERRRQYHFAITGQLQGARSIALVAQGQAADFQVVGSGDGNLHAQADAMVVTLEFRHMRMEGHLLMLGQHAGRLPARRPQRPALLVAQVDPQPLAVAGGIALPARQRMLMPVQPAATGGGYPTAQTAVAEHVNLGEQLGALGQPGMRRRHPTADRRLARLEPRALRRQFLRDALMQQQLHDPDPRFFTKTPHQHIGTEGIVQGGEDHALVMGHERAHGSATPATGNPLGGEVRRFVEPVAADQAEALQAQQIVQRGRRIDRQGQRRRVGRHHQIARLLAAQAQCGHPECPVAVAVFGIARGEGRFGDAPGHALVAAMLALHLDGGAFALPEQRAGMAGQQQRRHQVLEHRAIPGQQGQPAGHLRQGPTEAEPVFQGHIALHDGEIAGQSRLARQQVVMVIVQAVGTEVVANVEQP